MPCGSPSPTLTGTARSGSGGNHDAMTTEVNPIARRASTGSSSTKAGQTHVPHGAPLPAAALDPPGERIRCVEAALVPEPPGIRLVPAMLD